LRQALMPMHLRRSALSKKGHKGTAKTHRRTPPENVTEFCNTFLLTSEARTALAAFISS
jgi:hypothetical protein